MRTREQILGEFPERDLEGLWEVSPDLDSRWRAAVLEVLLDIREHLGALRATGEAGAAGERPS